MQLSHSLKTTTSQKLIITPKFCQAITILELSSLELAAMIEKELLENPVLEINEDDGENYTGDDYENTSPSADRITYEDWAEYFSQTYTLNKPADFPLDNKISPDLFAARQVTLHEHLEFQLRLAKPNASLKKTGEFLIGSIDDNGYLTTTVSEAASVLAASEHEVADALKLVQTFDPPGVGARDLKECLKIQLTQARPVSSPQIYHLGEAIIEKYLVEVARGKVKFIAAKLSANIPAVLEAIDIIRKFEPKPGRSFSDLKAAYLQPDVVIENSHDGHFSVTASDRNIPSIFINPYYRQIVQTAGAYKDAKKFVEEKLNSAIHLIKSIEQRKKTLLSVTETIVRLQHDFFERGVKFLRPMVMKEVADEVGIHESTVSRAVANKYAATGHGILPLNSFFSAALLSDSGQAVSASRIKRDILDLVASENPKNPLSDNDLSEIFARDGISVSRRTVTKYRKELSIPPSHLRRRH